jgi:hypothetical protein
MCSVFNRLTAKKISLKLSLDKDDSVSASPDGASGAMYE